MENNELIFLKPVFKHNVWGGAKLRTQFGFDVEGNDIGECWGIAAHPNGDAQIDGGKYNGKKLSELWNEHRELFGNADGDRFPLLVKIIDAKDDLSIQVHPGNEYAAEHENGSLGKNECWYVLSAEPGSKLVVGHNARTKEELDSMIDEGRFDELIREVPISKGDFIQIDSGTVHAIKGGIVLMETQQSSDITYRVYDYDRLWNGEKRELHIEKSKDVITVPAPEADKMILHEAVSLDDVTGCDDKLLVKCPYYEVRRLYVNGTCTGGCGDDYVLMTVVDGEGTVDGHLVHKGSFFIIPSGHGTLTITGKLNIIASRAF